ncbi:hypothetical protein CI238_12203, partial [Colletotrichum incanum]
LNDGLDGRQITDEPPAENMAGLDPAGLEQGWPGISSCLPKPEGFDLSLDNRALLTPCPKLETLLLHGTGWSYPLLGLDNGALGPEIGFTIEIRYL